MKKPMLLFALLVLLSCGAKEEKQETKSDDQSEKSSEVIAEDKPVTENPTEETQPDCAGKIEAYLNDPDLSGTNIRNAPNGKVIFKLIKTEENFEYFITCSEAKDGWFKIHGEIVSMESPVILEGENWIHGSVLGAGTRNYGNQIIEVYNDADKSKIINKIKQEVSLSFLDLCKNMVKVKWKDGNGKTQEGWIDVEWVCGNPLTTCS